MAYLEGLKRSLQALQVRLREQWYDFQLFQFLNLGALISCNR
jgi:hypothetical protein